MSGLFSRIGNGVQKIVDRFMGSGLSQEETRAEGERYVTPGIGEACRKAAAESIVLLKNDGMLPLSKDKTVAVFGRCQLDWFYVGYGSGGNVHAPYYVNLLDGLDNAGAAYDRVLADTYRRWTGSPKHKANHGWWGHWPFSHPEMVPDAETLRRAADNTDTALVVIGRAAGEDRDNRLEPGSYYLTDAELRLLDRVTEAFARVAVVLNTGSIIDMAWTERYGDKLSALLIAWLGGMESGNAVADVLYGAVDPCGRLPDTIARRYEDYPSAANFGGKKFNEYREGVFTGYRFFDAHPEKVLWPFGSGLSYARFEYGAPGDNVRLISDSDAEGAAPSRLRAEITVFCTGGQTPCSKSPCSKSRTSVALYCRLPEGNIPKPRRVLIGFGMTRELVAGEADRVVLEADVKSLASFDEARSAFVLEAGQYEFYAESTKIGEISLDFCILEQCAEICTSSAALRERILSNLNKGTDPVFKNGVENVAGADRAVGIAGRLTDDDLAALTRGHGMMNSPLGTKGNAGVLGGITPSLRAAGIPPIVTSDGPAGLRLAAYCALLPCGTALAACRDTALIERLFALVGQEMAHYGVDVFLGPGMNLHRNPLCGRNFEYFSEDPVLAGTTAAAVVRGIQSAGKAACPKHFACNNQEYRRNTNDSRLSTRALRELYLRGFEICVKTAAPLTLMTSYNKVNGVWAHYNYDLATTVLRDEWGFGGTVITDWWMRRSKSPEFPRLRDNAYRIRAGVDVLMPGNFSKSSRRFRRDRSLLRRLDAPGFLTRAELRRTAVNVIRLGEKVK